MRGQASRRRPINEEDIDRINHSIDEEEYADHVAERFAISEWDGETLSYVTTVDALSGAEFADVALPYLLPLCLSDDPIARHGAVSGVAQLVLGLGQCLYTMADEMLKTIRNVGELISMIVYFMLRYN